MFLVLLFNNTRDSAGATKMIVHELRLRGIKIKSAPSAKNTTFAERELGFQY